jgi:hypothetical protein
MAPTLLELGGYDVPGSMQGKPLTASVSKASTADTQYSATAEEIIRERLSGLGYIS